MLVSAAWQHPTARGLRMGVEGLSISLLCEARAQRIGAAVGYTGNMAMVGTAAESKNDAYYVVGLCCDKTELHVDTWLSNKQCSTAVPTSDSNSSWSTLLVAMLTSTWPRPTSIDGQTQRHCQLVDLDNSIWLS